MVVSILDNLCSHKVMEHRLKHNHFDYIYQLQLVPLYKHGLYLYDILSLSLNTEGELRVNIFSKMSIPNYFSVNFKMYFPGESDTTSKLDEFTWNLISLESCLS